MKVLSVNYSWEATSQFQYKSFPEDDVFLVHKRHIETRLVDN